MKSTMTKANKIFKYITMAVLALALFAIVIAATSTSTFAASRYDMDPKYDANGNQIVGYAEKDKGYDAVNGQFPDNAAAKMAGAAAVAAAPQLATAATMGAVGAASVAAPAAACVAVAAPLTAAEFAAPLALAL